MNRIISNIKRTLVATMSAVFLMGCHAHQVNLNAMPKRSSVKIDAGIAYTFCNQDSSRCETRVRMISSGSGGVISHHRDSSFTLTAGHLCEHSTGDVPLPPNLTSPEIISRFAHWVNGRGPLQFEASTVVAQWAFYIIDIDENRYFSLPVSISPPQDALGTHTGVDLCLLTSQRIPVLPMRLAMDQPQPGDRIYNSAAPNGVWFKGEGGMIYEGRLSSVDNSFHNNAVYTIPAAPGSSGSIILDENFHVVGVVSAVLLVVPNYTMGPNVEQIHCFLWNAFQQGKAMEAAPRGLSCPD